MCVVLDKQNTKVQENLPALLVKSEITKDKFERLEDYPPLMIGESASKLCSFKEMWNTAHALTSIQQSKMYEAGGSLLWCTAGADARQVPVNVYTWSQLEEAIDSTILAHPETSRLYIDGVFDGVVNGIEAVADQTPKGVKLLTKHLVAYCWWVSIFQAMCSEDVEKIKLLWQAALTITLRVRVASQTDAYTLAKVTIDHSESLKTQADCLCDSLPSFCQKLKIMIDHLENQGTRKQIDQVKRLSEDKVCFRKTLVHRTMLTACLSINSCLSQRSRSLLSSMESQHIGLHLFSRSYTRMYKLVTTVKAFQTKSTLQQVDANILMEQVLQYLFISLNRGQVTGEEITEEFLFGRAIKTPSKQRPGEADDDETNKAVGWVHATLVKLEVQAKAMQLLSLQSSTPASDKLVEAIQAVVNPFEYWRILHSVAAEQVLLNIKQK